MEKKIERVYVGEDKEFNASSWNENTNEIDEVIEFFVNAKKDGATHIMWHATSDFDGASESCEATPFFNELETDESFEKRVLEQNKIILEKEKKDRATYESLKSRFENEK